MKLKRTNSKDKDFIEKVKELDAYLAAIDGKEHAFYKQFNTIDSLKQVVVAYKNEIPVGCGAIKILDSDSVEVKRMYTDPKSRGNGVATAILLELELWAQELSYKRCVLETGARQPEAIKLYKKNNYYSIPNYGQYIGVENSRCFEKIFI